MKLNTATNEPLVSILINNYNYGRFIGEAIDSALSQTYSQIEVIVVDDGSTDNSREVIASYGSRIVPVLKANGGQASAFNAGFTASRGDIICFLDSDDIFAPNKVLEVMSVFESYPDVGWCFHTQRMVDTNTNKLIKLEPEGWSSCEIDFRPDIKMAKKPTFAPATSGLCFTRSLLQQILPMPEAESVSISDNYLKYTALFLSKGFFLSKELSILRIHGNNIYTLLYSNQADTLRSDKQRLNAEIEILTAYWMRVKFPGLEKFTNRLFGIGLGNYWRNGDADEKYKEIIKSYLSTIPLIERLEINLRAFYHSNNLSSTFRRFLPLRSS